MTKICTGCGKELANDTMFCTSCGTKALEPIQTEPTHNMTVSTGYYFGMMFVYALPVLGWLICLITSFAGKNDNKKHFARALLIWSVIGFVFGIIGYFMATWLGGVIGPFENGGIILPFK